MVNELKKNLELIRYIDRVWKVAWGGDQIIAQHDGDTNEQSLEGNQSEVASRITDVGLFAR